MIVARLTVHVRDLTQFLPFVTRILFYTSGVLFDVDTDLQGPPVGGRGCTTSTRVYQVLQIARLGPDGQTRPTTRCTGGTSRSGRVVTFVGGLLFFWVAEERYGRD